MKHIWVFIGLVSLVVSGCTAEWIIPEDYFVECNGPEDCPDTATCEATSNGTNVCVTSGRPECGNGVVEVGESCDDGNEENNDYCSSNCSEVTTVCGDDNVEPGEFCDDGPSNADGYFDGGVEACNSTCTGIRPYCGDGNRTDDEVCDNGMQNVDADSYTQTPSCTTSCDGYNKHCGDEQTTDGEVCDEGPLNSGEYEFYEHCNGACSGNYPAYCGDGIAQTNLGETCDDGNAGLTDACPSGPDGPCVDATCGDGYVNENYEDCDLGDVYSCEDVFEGYQTAEVACPNTCLYSGFGCHLREDVEFENEMVAVPAGTFWMGCNADAGLECNDGEAPYHPVYLDAFYIDVTEVTAGDYLYCVNAGVCTYEAELAAGLSTFDVGMDDYPINGVNWTEGQAYCNWLGKRLPTEAEWEKAARGTDGRLYPWGNDEPTCALTAMSKCSDSHQPVGQLTAGASPYGALDMAGSLFEWTADWYGWNYYSQTPSEGWNNPTGPETGNNRVLRGGSYWGANFYLRSDSRYFHAEYFHYPSFGFRCAKSAN